MALFTYKKLRPQVESNCFIADEAVVIGNVRLQSEVNIWFNCVVRADVNKITIGANTNIQDLSMLHVTEEQELEIGKNTTVGHSVILHACKIGDGCLIGMGATVLDGACIGDNCLVAAGSVVPPGKVFPAGSFIIGSPAVSKRELTKIEIEQYSNHYKYYLEYAREFADKKNIKRID